MRAIAYMLSRAKMKDIKSFGLSLEDIQDKDVWRLRLKGATG